MGRRRDDAAEHERQLAELEALGPYLPLARELHDELARAAADGSVDLSSVEDALAAVPRSRRRALVQATFDRLTPDQQWAVLERAFGDDDIRAHLHAEREARREELVRTAGARAVARAARRDRRLDVAAVPAEEELTLGLFRADDVRAALDRGRASTVCARQLVVRTTAEPGVVHVVEDVFNPRRGLFVTAAYDERTWATERLAGHARVRLGSLAPGAGSGFEPVLHPGGRVDVEADGHVREGRLHLGYALVGDQDVFASVT